MPRTLDDDPEDVRERSHLADVRDGCGCAEVWEYLSESREASNGGHASLGHQASKEREAEEE